MWWKIKKKIKNHYLLCKKKKPALEQRQYNTDDIPFVETILNKKLS